MTRMIENDLIILLEGRVCDIDTACLMLTLIDEGYTSVEVAKVSLVLWTWHSLSLLHPANQARVTMMDTPTADTGEVEPSL